MPPTPHGADGIRVVPDADPAGPRPRWLARHGDRIAGTLAGLRHPDGRLFVSFVDCTEDAYAPLAAAVEGECYLSTDGDLARFEGLGFRLWRTEHRYEVPIARIEAPLPAGIAVTSAADVAVAELMALDDALRQDVPGSDGWRNDPQSFREQTYDAPDYDPQTYLVARDGARCVGLMRVWIRPGKAPRLGLIAVLPAYRRRGLALALIARVFAVLHGRGVAHVTAEVDTTNTASRTLLTRLGGTVTGIEYQLRRPGTVTARRGASP